MIEIVFDGLDEKFGLFLAPIEHVSFLFVGKQGVLYFLEYLKIELMY